MGRSKVRGCSKRKGVSRRRLRGGPLAEDQRRDRQRTAGARVRVHHRVRELAARREI